MNTYYIKAHGVHEIHRENCVWLPIRKGMTKLGEFNRSEEAYGQANQLYNEVVACPTCCSTEKVSERKAS